MTLLKNWAHFNVVNMFVFMPFFKTKTKLNSSKWVSHCWRRVGNNETVRRQQWDTYCLFYNYCCSDWICPIFWAVVENIPTNIMHFKEKLYIFLKKKNTKFIEKSTDKKCLIVDVSTLIETVVGLQYVKCFFELWRKNAFELTEKRSCS